ncbi:MAG: ECF-type sigma factor [Chloroflexota bacterium]|nr:ECF-type sigma factor [Chloroflexota bacterium]
MGLSTDDVGEAQIASTVTRLSNQACEGDRHAAAELLPLVYEQLRRLAHHHMSKERADQTLQPTALVHEAYLRLLQGGEARAFQGRWHFYGAVAEAMRRILIDAARRRGRLKRGGGSQRVELDQLRLSASEPGEDLLALDEGLAVLAEQHPQKAELVKLRYFAGLTIEDAATALGISVATANRYWAYARAWLYRHVTSEDAPPGAAPPPLREPATGATISK